MIRRGERLVATPNIGGVVWQVVESEPKIEKDLKGQQGVCKPDRQICYINRLEVPPEGIEYVAAHEIGHAVIFTIGGKHALKQITGLNEKKLEELEEFIVGTILHGVWDTNKRNGWLTIPIAPPETS